jgi:radical SAM superfamily enzyme
LSIAKKQYSSPLSLAFSSSKNSPDRVAKIAQLLADNEMINTQPVSLQTLNDHTSEAIQRQKVKQGDYLKLQASLNENQVGSYIELIWPLPGETLQTFLSGMATFIRSNARTLVVYPNLLLKNTPMHRAS